MQLSGNWLLAERLATTALYKLLRLVFIVVQRRPIYWQLNGTAQKLREARLLQNYDRSAQVLDVVLFHKFSSVDTITVDDILCTHNRFENPQYTIDNDNVTLMTTNEHDAVFCETVEKGIIKATATSDSGLIRWSCPSLRLSVAKMRTQKRDFLKN